MVFSAIRNAFLTSGDPERAAQVFGSFLGAKGFRKGEPAKPKLQLNDENNDTYVHSVIQGTAIDDVERILKKDRKSLTPSNTALLHAYKFFLEQVSSEVSHAGTQADDAFLVPLLDCLRNDVKLITIPVTSEEDANLFFESLNARGRELAVSDLVKNRLYAESKASVDRVQKKWQRMASELRSPIPEFIRHYWIAKKASGLVREKDLYKLVVREVRGNPNAAVALASDLAASALDYSRIVDYELWDEDPAYDEEFARTLDELKLFRVSQCNPILLNGIQIFKQPKQVAKLFRIVANFSFRYFIIGNQSPGNLERESNRIAEKIRDGSLKDAADVAQAFAAVNPDAAFRAAFELAEFPRTRAKHARYALSRISNYLCRNRGESEQVVNESSKAVNLEHVLPQKCGASWSKYFTAGIDPGDYVYRIGNLTLLSAKRNAELGALSYPKKRAVLTASKLPINDDFRNQRTWGNAQINSRQARLAKEAVQVWRL